MVKEASLRFVIGGAVGLMKRAVMGGEQVGKMCGVAVGLKKRKASSGPEEEAQGQQ